jgi:NAD(P)-dependent dehydrogenase (short-subunit alcohol dehydrogenase family)
MRRAAAAALRLRPDRALPSSLRALASSSAPPPPPRVAVVQGASRGLGLELARQLALERGAVVVATCRDPAASPGLAALAAAAPPGRVTVLRLDLTDDASIEAAAAAVGDAHGGGVDLLFNASGVLHAPGLTPETSLARVTRAALATAFEVNAAGPILVARAFEPLLRTAGVARAKRGPGTPPAVLASLSARVGSIGDNGMGGWHAYRASKTALNQLTRNAAVEFARKKAGVAAVVLHPGTCDTDLSKPFQRGVPQGKLFPVERGARQLLDIVDGLTLDDNGAFIAWDGARIPW